MAHAAQSLHIEKFKASSKIKNLSYAFIAIGVATFAFALSKNQERAWASYLTAFFFFATLGIGGLFFVAINNVAKAGWSVTIRRMSESMTSFIPGIIVGSLILILGLKHLYPWADAERVAADPLLLGKAAYLNTGFLIARLLIFGVGSFFFAKKIVGSSIKQDQTGDEEITHKNVGRSIGFLLFFAISFSLFSVDLLMSLMPYWYSTIFGVYTFSGLFQSTMAAMILITYWVKNQGFVKGYINEEHIHDMAKYMKAFTVFWAYIAFSQFMLIWYANIPEETEYYLLRAQGGWMGITVALLIFRFVVPFIALLPRWAKRTESHLKAVCILILFMQYLDIYWIVYPNFNDNNVVFSFTEVGVFLGFAGAFMVLLCNFLSKNSLVAIKDPRLDEALSHHVTY